MSQNCSLVLNSSFGWKNSLSLRFCSKRIIYISAFVLILCFSIFYIFQINQLISEKYLIQRYKQELKQIEKENDELAIRLIQDSSLSYISWSTEEKENLLEDMGFQKIDRIYYIQDLDNQFVAR